MSHISQRYRIAGERSGFGGCAAAVQPVLLGGKRPPALPAAVLPPRNSVSPASCLASFPEGAGGVGGPCCSLKTTDLSSFCDSRLEFRRKRTRKAEARLPENRLTSQFSRDSPEQTGLARTPAASAVFTTEVKVEYEIELINNVHTALKELNF